MNGRHLVASLALLAACAPHIAPSPHTPVTAKVVAPLPSRPETPDAPFRASAPPHAPSAPFAGPPIRTLHLSNGVPVLFLEQHVPALLRVEIVARTDAAPLGANAMASRALWFGSAHRNRAELAAARDSGLGRSWTWATGGAMGTGITGLSARADATIALLAEVALEPKFSADQVLRENALEFEERAHRADAPATIASRVLPMALYGWDHPADELELLRASDFGALVRDDIMHAYEAAFDPGSATLVVIGDTTAEALLPMLERSFGTWKGHGKHLHTKATPPTPVVGTPRLVVVDRPHSPESYVLCGGPGVAFRSADSAPALVMNALFGGANGTATRALRDQDHLVWGASSDLMMPPSHPWFQWHGELPAAQTAEGLRELDRQMRAMQRTDVPAGDLEDARQRLVRLGPSWLGSFDSETSTLNALVMHGLPPEDPAEAAARYEAVTAADIRRMASTLLDPDKMKIVIVGDWSVLEPQLTGLGWGAIELRDANGLVKHVQPAGGSR